MAAAIKNNNVDDPANSSSSPRFKGRDTGHTDAQAKKMLNVDSPSFTPSFLSPNGSNAITVKKPAGISPKAASAAPFMPKAIITRPSNTTPLRQDARTPDWVLSDLQEFVPRQQQESSLGSESDVSIPQQFDSFQSTHAANPYLEHNMNGQGFYQASSFQQPVQYHNYAPIGHFNSNLTPYQRTAHDLFIPNALREDIQKKSAAALQTLPNSQLPNHIESYHSLVPLDTNHKGSTIFGGYTSWVYKAQSSANGHFFALRRIEGFRLTNEMAIRAGQAWKQISNASIVRVVDVFTNRGFGDSSLFIATDYHPLSKTLLEHHHLGQNWSRSTRNTKEPVTEALLWNYIVQITSALKTIHAAGLAARVVDASKILVTGKNRIRLNGCSILDVVQFESGVSIPQLQRQDLANFGLVILSIGSGTSDLGQNFARSMDLFNRYYKPELQNAVMWLYSAIQNQDKTIDQFVTLIANQMVTSFNAALHNDDALCTDLAREVENARLVRLMAKINFVTERTEYEHDRAWSENGERYFIKLFRDYVFHQVDAQNRPVVDLAHVLNCLNKLDAGSHEKMTLISRDEQSCFVVSFAEVKKGIENAFAELTKGQPQLR
ncbi:hypothetical protein B0A52_03966 [Exophiala mesophila]|uniref:PAN2-PAN3 deadenylation complex subunit PAN3 n=1 Tax=Exophiala mesophila TaxID=212818 RepID=A0A438N9W4_EXOME|nr:hypothetical protein B0A52_03966 [Exophiala mesophila]